MGRKQRNESEKKGRKIRGLGSGKVVRRIREAENENKQMKKDGKKATRVQVVNRWSEGLKKRKTKINK